MLTPRQVAEMFNVHPTTVGRWETEGRLVGVRTPGNHRRFREADVLALLGEESAAEPAEPEAAQTGSATLATLASIGGFLLAVGIGLLIYFLVFATADVRGRVAVHNTVLSGQSRLELTRHFHDLYATIRAQEDQAVQSWQTYQQDKADHGGDPYGQHAQTVSTDLANYNGVVQLCIQNVNDYDQQASDSTRGLFVEANLPTSVDPKDCETK